jgi:predicted nucleic acid-binding protein
MPTAVIDSNVVLAHRLERDQHHKEGKAIVNAIDAGTLPTGRLTEIQVTEVLNPIQKLAGHDRAVETLTLLETAPGIEMETLVATDETRARELFRRQTAPEFSDALIGAYMERTGIEFIYSFDDDFDEFEHISRLNTATNPFE